MPLDEFVWLAVACAAAGAVLLATIQRWWKNRG